MEIHAILTETLAGFLPGRAKDLSASRICHAQIIFFHDYLAKTLLGEEYKMQSSWVCNCLHLPVTSALLLSNISSILRCITPK